METNKSKQNEPAFPSLSQMNESGYISNENFGMSKRFYAACAAMQGIAAMHSSKSDIDNEWICKTAFNMADELLKQENE